MLDKLMDKIADALSTKTCFFIFLFIAFVPLFISPPNNILAWQVWISQTTIQLVALNVLGRVSNKEGRDSRKLAQETHDTVMKELSNIKEILKEEKRLRALLSKLTML